MTDETTGNPITEGVGHAARQAAEVVAVLAMGAQAALRVRERQLRAHTDLERGQLRAEHAAARLTWDPATWLASAASGDAARVWATAQPWASHDPTAADVARRAEARLDELVPDLMIRYHHLRDQGTEPATAMRGAATQASAEADAQRAAAAAGFATPDVPSTRLDEHHQGATVGAGHAEFADAEAARAAVLAAVAYPRPVTAAVASPTPQASSRRATAARRFPHRERGR